jgi:hypothetical protein
MTSKVLNFIEKCEEVEPSFILLTRIMKKFITNGLPKEKNVVLDIDDNEEDNIEDALKMSLFDTHFHIHIIAYMLAEDDATQQYVKRRLMRFYYVGEYVFEELLEPEYIDHVELFMHSEMYYIFSPQVLMALIVHKLRWVGTLGCKEQEYVRHITSYYQYRQHDNKNIRDFILNVV